MNTALPTERSVRDPQPVVTLRGRGHGERSVVAMAALLGESDGRLTLSADLIALAARTARYSSDPQEIILVAQSGPAALFLPLPPGLRLAGLISEQEMPEGLTLATPTVSGVAEARERIAEGVLLLLDAQRGRVLVEPDAEAVAAAQAGVHRARFRVGAAHVPARTQGGRQVAVWAIAKERADIDTALFDGADGLFIPAGSDLSLPLASDDPLPALLELAEAFGGGDIALALSGEALAPVALTRAAAFSLLRVALPLADLPLSPAELRQELETIVQQEADAGRRASLFGIAALFPDLDDPEIATFDELYIAPEVAATLSLTDSFALPPLYAVFDNPFDDELTNFEAVINGGVAGVIVPPSRVTEAKERVRNAE